MNLAAHLIDRARRRWPLAQRWSGRSSGQPSGLLFVFQGRQGFRVGMGNGLYAAEPVFRASVDRCARVIEDRLHVDLAAGFHDADAARRAHDDEFHSILTHGLLHIGLTELWRSKGVEPSATVGLSLGEITSTVAAGMLTAEEAITVVQAAAQWDERLLAHGKLLLLEAGLATALAACRDSPASLECFAEYGPAATVVFCAADDVAVISGFLEGRRIAHEVHRGDYAYHTPRFASCKEQILVDLAHLRPKPQNFPFYSSLAGGLLPATAFTDARYWYWMLAQPVWFNTAFEAALSDGYDVVLNIGPHPSLDPHLRAAAAKLGKTPLFLNSLQDHESEDITFGRSLDQLRKLGLVRPPTTGRGLDGPGVPDAADFGSEEAIRDPYPLLEALRARGPVHFLPRHGYWLVLGHQEVAAALRLPDLFTSAPGVGMDPILLAAPPEHHARARRIVASSLRPEQEIRGDVIAIADHLLDSSDKSGRLDLVADFAVPLSEGVAARFFGLTEAEFGAISQIVGADRYSLAYVPALRAWFARYADEDGKPDTLLARMTGGAGDRFTAAEAASILTLMWVAGTTTTGMLIASAAKILLYQPDVRAEVIEHPGLISDLIEETLRIEPPEQTVWRRTSADASLGGVTIPAGAEVRLSLAAANRDPGHYADAASFILHRKPAHLAFGGGLHHCIGAGLARLTARIALERLLHHVPHMRPELPINRLRYTASDHFRSLAALGTLTGHPS